MHRRQLLTSLGALLGFAGSGAAAIEGEPKAVIAKNSTRSEVSERSLADLGAGGHPGDQAGTQHLTQLGTMLDPSSEPTQK